MHRRGLGCLEDEATSTESCPTSCYGAVVGGVVPRVRRWSWATARSRLSGANVERWPITHGLEWPRRREPTDENLFESSHSCGGSARSAIPFAPPRDLTPVSGVRPTKSRAVG